LNYIRLTRHFVRLRCCHTSAVPQNVPQALERRNFRLAHVGRIEPEPNAPLARRDSRNIVAELAHLTGRLEQPLRDAWADRLAERDAEETLFHDPQSDICMARPDGFWPCRVRDIAPSTPGVSAASTQSSCFVDAPDCHVGRSDCRSVAGFRGRHGIGCLATSSLIALASARSRSVSARWYLIAMSAAADTRELICRTGMVAPPLGAHEWRTHLRRSSRISKGPSAGLGLARPGHPGSASPEQSVFAQCLVWSHGVMPRCSALLPAATCRLIFPGRA